MPKTHGLTSEDVLQALRSAGGEESAAALARRFGVARGTILRRLGELEEAGVAQHKRGTFTLVPRQRSLPSQAREIVQIIEDAGLDAHLTGLDPLLPYVHQFVREFPHLVYCEPAALNAVEFELTANGYMVIILGRGPIHSLPSAPDPSRLVFLRAQPNAYQYGVNNEVAPREKAWVDLLRESVRGTLPVQRMELGRILRMLLDAGARPGRLRRYAQQLGYRQWVDCAIDGGDCPDPDMQALRAGFNA